MERKKNHFEVTTKIVNKEALLQTECIQYDQTLFNTYCFKDVLSFNMFPLTLDIWSFTTKETTASVIMYIHGNQVLPELTALDTWRYGPDRSAITFYIQIQNSDNLLKHVHGHLQEEVTQNDLFLQKLTFVSVSTCRN